MFFEDGAARLLSVASSVDCVEIYEDRQLAVFGIGEVDLPVEFASRAPRWKTIPEVFKMEELIASATLDRPETVRGQCFLI